MRVVFLDPVSDKQLSCKDTVGAWMTRSETAQRGKNETASACFRDAGYFRYIVRTESALTTGDINVQGVIKVGERAARPLLKRVIKTVVEQVGQTVIKPVGHEAQRRPPPVLRRPLTEQVVQPLTNSVVLRGLFSK